MNRVLGVTPGHFIGSVTTASNIPAAGGYITVNGASNSTISAMQNSSGVLQLTGEKADLVVNGKSLTQALDAIEQRLGLLTPNSALEAEWNELKALGDAYRALEAQLKEKAQVWVKLSS